MQYKDLPLFIRQLKNYFPDSKLNDAGSQQMVDKFAASTNDQAEISMEEFLRLLMSVEKPKFVPEHEERAENNDYKTAELKDRIELLMEDNQSLKTDLQQSSKTELDLKKRISQLENQLAEEHTRSKKGGIEQQSLVEIKYTLDRQPVNEVRDKVFGFIDRLIDKTTAINSERLTLASIKNSEASQDLVQAVEDVQRSFQLQAELLQIYEEITPAQNAVVPNVPAEAKKKDKVDQIEALLQQNHHQQHQTLTQRRPSFKAPEPVSPREVIVEPPLIVKKTGVFAFYSLFLWFMGIVTTLTVIEYVSVADWAVDTPAASHIVY